MKEFIKKLISRLEAVRDAGTTMIGSHYFDDGVDAAINTVKQVAEEYKGGWIPCSERLPEVNQKVIVTYKDRYIGGCDGVCDGMYVYSWEQWDISDYDCKDDFEVIAWQPFPQAYQPKDMQSYETI